jgi:hypothetical protein
MGALIDAKIDPADSTRIVFRDAISLQSAIGWLWDSPSPPPGTLRPDPSERAVAGKQRRFILKMDDMATLLRLRHGLGNQYLNLIRTRGVIESKGKPHVPAWVPVALKEKIVGKKLPVGVHHFPGEKPFGEILIWVSPGPDRAVQMFQEYPDSENYYLEIANGDQYKAHLLHKVYTQFNSDMRVFVLQRGMSIENARDEIQRISEECFKLILEGMAMMMTAGAGISSISQSVRNSTTRMVSTFERHGFGRSRSKPSAVGTTPPAPNAPPPRATGGAAGAPGAAVRIKNYGGPANGQQIGMIRSQPGINPEIAMERRLPSGIAHRDLGKKAFGSSAPNAAVGERRFGITAIGPEGGGLLVHETSGSMTPLWSDLPVIEKALRAIGILEGTTVWVIKEETKQLVKWQAAGWLRLSR